MKNELNWQHSESGGFPMKLVEKGLNIKGKAVVLFYLSAFMAIASMVWVIMLSLRILQVSYGGSTVPEYYTTIAVVCIAVCLITIHHFYKVLRDRRAYYKEITIADGLVNFTEITHNGKTEWKEKLKKFSGIGLKHYKHRNQSSWYIAIIHDENGKSIPVFSPDAENQNATEEVKREQLARMGSAFGLLTHYEKPKTEEKES